MSTQFHLPVSLSTATLTKNKKWNRRLKFCETDSKVSTPVSHGVYDKKIISADKENAELLHSFFPNAVKILKILEFSRSNPLAENISLRKSIVN